VFVCPECGRRSDRAGYCATEGKPLVQTDDTLLGSEVDRYRLARVLGEGGMGRVYLAVQPAIGSRVAIKVLSEECARNAELLDRFFAEAKAVNLIRHEHIVSVLDLARLPDGRPFIVMEFIEGQTLASIVRRAPAPLGGVVQVMGEVLGALAAAHAIGIVHRDLKPDNVLVTLEGHAKVLDFGIAKLAPGLRDQSPRTRTGALMGTPAYMAPEQISGAGHVDARTDIYAAGVVLFEACTGVQPFAGATLFDLMRAHVEMPPPSPRALRPDLPDGIEHVILTALAKDPGQRFQGAAAMAQALAHAATALPPGAWLPLSSRSGPPTPQVSSSRPRLANVSTAAPTAETRRTRRIVVPLVVALVAVFAALFVVASHHDRATAPPADPPATPAPAPPPVALVTPEPPPPPPAPAPTAPSPPTTPAPTAPSPAPRPEPAHPLHRAAPPVAADPGPIAGGGGSAADHGVYIGPNVHVGSNVIVGSQTPIAAAAPHTASAPADYDPRHFDPVSYLPKALALARTLAPDAQLTSFEFDPVYSDGRVDLTSEGRDREYEFRSPSRSAHPADVPRNVAVERACMIHVEVSATGAAAELRKSDSCDARLVIAPRCHFGAVWKMAIAAGTPSDLVARVGWLYDQKWFFDTDPDSTGKFPGVSSFADRCP